MTIQIIPVVTEKATAVSEKNNRYTFKVSPEANKFQIKDAVEKMYEVKVVGVSTMNYDGKKKQRYTRTGLLRGKVAAFKKAVVTLAEGQTIDFYSNI
ncbi:MAG: 50S ribosomal protein L23 [Muribaculaceae bacterium]|nr:50S ribosomal protein L23 [Muribaculaceae bacterium]HAP51238.1 50S ribosomal protein L23 [Porphyromonadaceae bacterium]